MCMLHAYGLQHIHAGSLQPSEGGNSQCLKARTRTVNHQCPTVTLYDFLLAFLRTSLLLLSILCLMCIIYLKEL